MLTLLNDNESGGGRSAGGNGGGSGGGGGFNTDNAGRNTGTGFDGGTFNGKFHGDQWSGPFVSPAVQMEEMNWNKTKNNERRSKGHTGSGQTRGRRGQTRWDEGTGNGECQNALNTQVEPGELNDENNNETRRNKNHQRQKNKLKRPDKRAHTAKQEFYEKDLMKEKMKLAEAEAAARKSKRAQTSRSPRSIVPLLSISPLAPPPPLTKLNKGGDLITANGTVIPPLVPPLLLPGGYSLLNAIPIVQGPVVPLSSTSKHVTPLMQTKNY